MKTKYIYLHGFNSDSDKNSDKTKILETIGEVVHLSYDSFDTYENIMESLMLASKDHATDIGRVIIGTSLGGFYAAELGKRLKYPSILINPCINPWESLLPMCGETFTNYKNGNIRVLEEEVINSYEDNPFANGNLYDPLVLLDAGDELLDAPENYKYFSDMGYPVKMFEGGSHRFDHMLESLPVISEYLSDQEFF